MEITEEQSEKAAQVFEEVRLVTEILNNDASTIIKHLEMRSDVDFWIRTFVRSLFAQLESNLFQLRRMILALNDLGFGELDAAEIALLKNKVYEVNNKGDVRSREARIATASHFLFAVKMASK